MGKLLLVLSGGQCPPKPAVPRAGEGEARLRQGYGGRRWSWRESNPRPNKQQKCFLHAYTVIGFRELPGNSHPNQNLISFISPK